MKTVTLEMNVETPEEYTSSKVTFMLYMQEHFY